MSMYSVFAFPPQPVTRPALSFGILSFLSKHVAQLAMTFGLALSGFIGTPCIVAAEDRELKLFFTHTGERATITFKRNGRYDQKGLAQINRFLRDWRRNEPARMDPRLLDLVWEVYKKSGARDYIHIVSAYRSPTTNTMLRGRSRNSGVAKNSQHTLGKAMDFFIPGVKLATLRGLAMQMQVGGVGYYPTSGSPFVHLDVGNVRAWPRMSRQELARLFPNGRTMHLPADGQPLAGYNQAMADYRKRAGSKSVTVEDEDEDDAAPATKSSILTAMLPTPKKAAEEALALQTRPQGVIPVSRSSVFPDFVALNAPVPLFRPVETVKPEPLAEPQAPAVAQSAAAPAEAPAPRQWVILAVADLNMPPAHAPFGIGGRIDPEALFDEDPSADPLRLWALGASDGGRTIHAQQFARPQEPGAVPATTDVARSALPPWANGG